MKKILLLFSLITCSFTPLWAYKILYAEQFFRLYHLHFTQYPDDTLENIYYLEQALKADFCNPLYALAKIQNTREWERYRYLFKMHVNLKLVEAYLLLGSKFDKMIAYFYNAPWKNDNLESLKTAEQAYEFSIKYWEEAKKWAVQADGLKFLHLEAIQYWEDENFRILSGELDYGDIIQSHLARLKKVRADFEKMDKNTY
ncbi:MAG: hypothetical protein AB1798_19345 [Spirochaetota bacterium]